MSKNDGNSRVSPRRRCAPSLPKKARPRTDYGPLLDLHVRSHSLPAGIPEFRFHPVRRWRFDRAWPDQRVAIEIEGGVFVQGRHTRGPAFEADCVKYATALTLGWRVLRVTPRQVKSGLAVGWLAELLAHPAAPGRS